MKPARQTGLSHFSMQAGKMTFTTMFSALAIIKNIAVKTSLISFIPVICWVNKHVSWLKVLRSVCGLPSPPRPKMLGTHELNCGVSCRWVHVPSCDSCWSVLEQERNWISFSCTTPALRSDLWIYCKRQQAGRRNENVPFRWSVGLILLLHLRL